MWRQFPIICKHMIKRNGCTNLGCDSQFLGTCRPELFGSKTKSDFIFFKWSEGLLVFKGTTAKAQGITAIVVGALGYFEASHNISSAGWKNTGLN